VTAHGAGLELFDDGVAGFAFDQGEDAVMHVAAHHGVAFPVSDVLAQLDFGRPVADGSLAKEHAPGIVAAVALTPKLAQDPGVTPQISSASLVPVDLAIDRLVTDAQAALFPPHADNLFGAVPAANQAGHLRHVGGAEVSPVTAAPPAGGGIAVSPSRRGIGRRA
jgi:hypothetical protein